MYRVSRLLMMLCVCVVAEQYAVGQGGTIPLTQSSCYSSGNQCALTCHWEAERGGILCQVNSASFTSSTQWSCGAYPCKRAVGACVKHLQSVETLCCANSIEVTGGSTCVATSVGFTDITTKTGC